MYRHTCDELDPSCYGHHLFGEHNVLQVDCSELRTYLIVTGCLVFMLHRNQNPFIICQRSGARLTDDNE